MLFHWININTSSGEREKTQKSMHKRNNRRRIYQEEENKQKAYTYRPILHWKQHTLTPENLHTSTKDHHDKENYTTVLVSSGEKITMMYKHHPREKRGVMRRRRVVDVQICLRSRGRKMMSMHWSSKRSTGWMLRFPCMVVALWVMSNQSYKVSVYFKGSSNYRTED